ncbi:TPA: metallophosphoesterase, partial [Legionella pneumophila]|nr:metallophosphoesterase [Legionella pneumophila]
MKIIHISDLHFGMHQPKVLNTFLREISLNKPDIILISGDLTQRGLSYQYREFCSFINQLPVKALSVPGNHDIPLYNFLARFISPFRHYKRYINPDITTTFENDFVRILGVNSVNPLQLKDGKLSHEILNMIKRYFKPDDEKLNLLFFH